MSRPKIRPKNWTMPKWMEVYRKHIVGNGEPVERLQNGEANMYINAPLALIQMGVNAQISLLTRLHEDGWL